MNLAYKKILGKFTKVLGFGKTPPPCWENFPNNIVFFNESEPYCFFALFLFTTVVKIWDKERGEAVPVTPRYPVDLYSSHSRGDIAITF